MQRTEDMSYRSDSLLPGLPSRVAMIGMGKNGKKLVN